MATLIIVIGFLLLIIVYVISIYNRLVTLRNRFTNSFAQIEVQLKRRYDLIPNLISTAKGYMQHEQETLQQVIQARNQAISGLKAASAAPESESAIEQLAQAEGGLNNALSKLNVVVEAYPDLKASQTMVQLQEELASTENKVAFARQAFNDSVTVYNTYKQTFPPVLLANIFGFQHAQLLEFSDSEAIQEAPRVADLLS
ncbi:LemA family protein [Vibrio sp. V27_P1S3P104]|uniref:LemA family protein n=1 Tax=unclassified Vibrio TaxID=2614977 RepID=UPI0013735C1E|nr:MULTISPECIES: LemA family protein [unclassified Vibrio]NAW69739.1 LemA family protein [Vibrio sp. V28_P6S34P95]NAX06304.1 LemA family protein [Vibrio sp. V30_P3S12P165]NAX34062.1 LemA family protein [Vibrio sp. V29_P1S30P107]NAX37921.1 LemA family protein [Vibrio sp. V27_P1S3P104]NAX39723.1 LemA family protein [Vibrio sp. V26_P1S5P106]